MDGEHFNLNKFVFSEEDFDQLDWNDCRIYSIDFRTKGRLNFDIDYIFKSVPPEGFENFYKFWVAPCTLSFENVTNISISLDSAEFEIRKINLVNPKMAKFNPSVKKYEFIFDIITNAGVITFTSTGFKMTVNSPPVLIDRQNIGHVKRQMIYKN